MTPTHRLFVGFVFLTFAVVGFAAGRALLGPKNRVSQPIAFNHVLHSETLECETCHEYFLEGAHSGLPGLSTCLQCHDEAVTESAEEEKIRQLAADGEEQVFRKLFRLPDNVFYTHRRHAGIAGLECEICHGDIAQTEAPPEVPLKKVTMDFCLDCHRDSGVSNDCTRCHR